MGAGGAGLGAQSSGETGPPQLGRKDVPGPDPPEVRRACDGSRRPGCHSSAARHADQWRGVAHLCHAVRRRGTIRGIGLERKHETVGHGKAVTYQPAEGAGYATAGTRAGVTEIDDLPPSAVDLTQFALWRASELDSDDLLDALTLLPAARAEVEGLEAGLLFIARGAGLTWAQIADAMGFKSPQACQQHFNRLSARQTGES